MTLPIATNTTGDVYRSGTAPPANPAVEALPLYLSGDYRERMQIGAGLANALRFTHTALVAVDSDIRDGFASFASVSGGDILYIPDRTGTPYLVVFIERHGRGLATDHKKIYLNRDAVDWVGTVTVGCCGNALSKALVGTISNKTGACSCLPDAVTLIWNAGTSAWEANITTCSSDMTLAFSCGGADCSAFSLDVNGSAGGPDSCTCSPLSLTFANRSGGSSCTGNFDLQIGELASETAPI